MRLRRIFTKEMKKMKRNERYMWIRTTQQALDIIANLLAQEAPIEEQDAWLEAIIKLELVNMEDIQ